MTGARSAAGRVPPTTTSAMASAHDQTPGQLHADRMPEGGIQRKEYRLCLLRHRRHRLIEYVNDDVDLRRVDDERRRETNRVAARAEHEQASREAAVDHAVAFGRRALLRQAIRTSSTPIMSPRPRTSPTTGCFCMQRAQPPQVARRRSAAFSTRSSLRSLSWPAPRRSRPGCRRTCWRGRRAATSSLGPGDGHAQRHARGDALGQGDDVGLDAEVLAGEHLPVRPMPDCTSSTTSRMPCFRVRSRSR